jgi:Arc/MetJ-type ribon-helix-helix transcriptional regulator
MTSIHVRLDPESETALTRLMEEGIDRSEAVRRALIAQADLVRQKGLQAVLTELQANPDYQTEIERVQADMDPLRAW